MGCGLFYIAHEAGGDAEETLALTVGIDGPCAVLVVDAGMEHYGVDIFRGGFVGVDGPVHADALLHADGFDGSIACGGEEDGSCLLQFWSCLCVVVVHVVGCFGSEGDVFPVPIVG